MRDNNDIMKSIDRVVLARSRNAHRMLSMVFVAFLSGGIIGGALSLTRLPFWIKVPILSLGIIGCLQYHGWKQRQAERVIRSEILKKLGRCTVCEYNLCSMSASVCPECGNREDGDSTSVEG